ncbi:MAG TPA: hypothetical protein VFC18_09085 [Burkholderiales bacterium]|nr:hypothetical protein [Burkholderiales bacterium]
MSKDQWMWMRASVALVAAAARAVADRAASDGQHVPAPEPIAGR